MLLRWMSSFRITAVRVTFGGFALGAQLLIKRFDEWVVQGGAECRHVERLARGSPSAPDVPLPAHGSAVRVHRGYARQSSDSSTRQLAQFGQVREQAVRADGSHARDLGQPFDARLDLDAGGEYGR